MPTPGDLVEAGLLLKVEGVLDASELEVRLLYACPRAATWMDETLDGLASDGFYENAATPIQQADDLFYSFISGDDLSSNDWPPHVMRPSDDGVWELRTADLRFFGWFWRKGVFIISAVDQAQRCKRYNLYAGYRDQCIEDRNSLSLDAPAFVNGEPSDVL